MKLNCCANCKYRKAVSHFTYDACFSQQIKDMYRGYDEVTGVPDYMEENCCLTVRSYFCKGDWFESKKSFIDKLVCLFKQFYQQK